MSTLKKSAIAALFLVSTTAFGATVKQKVDVTYDLKQGQRLVLENDNGSVHVEAWDRPQVRIEAEKVVKAGGDERANEVLKRVKVQVIQRPDRVTISTVAPEGNDNVFSWIAGMRTEAWVNYKITVPRTLNLSVETVNGSVTASDISGDLEIETTNGKIDLQRASGRVNLSTTNGGITAQMRELGSTGPHSIDTTNGAVRIDLPAATRAQLDVQTTNGSIRSDFPVPTTGDDNSLKSAINGGGPALVVRTTNGSVKIGRI